MRPDESLHRSACFGHGSCRGIRALRDAAGELSRLAEVWHGQQEACRRRLEDHRIRGLGQASARSHWACALSLEPSGMGSMGFIAISGGIDYRRTYRDGKPSVEFSWEGIDEGDPRCNRGWPVLAGDTMHGRLFIHASDDSALRSVRVS